MTLYVNAKTSMDIELDLLEFLRKCGAQATPPMRRQDQTALDFGVDPAVSSLLNVYKIEVRVEQVDPEL